MPKFRLSYYLLGESIKSVDEARAALGSSIETYTLLQPNLATDEGEAGKLVGLHKAKATPQPGALAFLRSNFVGLDDLEWENFSHAAAMLVPTQGRIMLVTFGSAFTLRNYLPVVRDFGLTICQNWMHSKRVRAVLSEKTGEKSKARLESRTRDGDLGDFELPDRMAFVRAITGYVPSDYGDVLVDGGMGLAFPGPSNIPELYKTCKTLLDHYLHSAGADKEFAKWQVLRPVPDPSQESSLMAMLLADMTVPPTSRLALSGASPWVYEADKFVLSTPGYGVTDVGSPLTVANIVAHVKQCQQVHGVDPFSTFVTAVFEDEEVESWILPQLLTYQTVPTADNPKLYYWINGQWNEVGRDLVQQVNDEVEALAASSAALLAGFALPPYDVPTAKPGDKWPYGETKYNLEVPTKPGFKDVVVLDKAKFRVPIDNSRLEAADLFHPSGHLVHIKRGSGWSGVEEVCGQVLQAATAMRMQPAWVAELRAQYKKATGKDLPFFDVSKITFVVALVDNATAGFPTALPFRSKWALEQLAVEMRRIGQPLAFYVIHDQVNHMPLPKASGK